MKDKIEYKLGITAKKLQKNDANEIFVKKKMLCQRNEKWNLMSRKLHKAIYSPGLPQQRESWN